MEKLMTRNRFGSLKSIKKEPKIPSIIQNLLSGIFFELPEEALN
jgi:hypothetical protein